MYRGKKDGDKVSPEQRVLSQPRRLKEKVNKERVVTGQRVKQRGEGRREFT